MEIRNRGNSAHFQDLCGVIVELGGSASVSVAEGLIDIARSHLHKKTEEYYYVLRGLGRMHIGHEAAEVRPGDFITIPPNTYHHIERVSNEPLEILIITHPRFDPADIYPETPAKA